MNPNPEHKVIMRIFLVFLFILFTHSLFAQQPSKSQIESLLQGSWKDSTGAIVKFDCLKGDSVIGYGLLDKKENEMGWHVTFKVEWNATYDKSLKHDGPTGYYFLKEIASSEDILGRAHIRVEIKISQITDTHLCLRPVIGSLPHKLLTYSKVR